MAIQENNGDGSLIDALISGSPLPTTAPKTRGRPKATAGPEVTAPATAHERYVTRELGRVNTDEEIEANKRWLNTANPAIWTGVNW